MSYNIFNQNYVINQYTVDQSIALIRQIKTLIVWLLEQRWREAESGREGEQRGSGHRVRTRGNRSQETLDTAASSSFLAVETIIRIFLRPGTPHV